MFWLQCLIFDYTLFEHLKTAKGDMQVAFEHIVQEQGLYGSDL